VFLFLSKLIPRLIFPPGVLLIGIAAAWVLRNRFRRLATVLFVVSLVSLAFLYSDFSGQLLLHPLEEEYRERSPEALPRADAIVILGGAVRAPGGEHARPELDIGADRVLFGVELFRAGKAPLIAFSGGAVGVVGVSESPEALAAARILQQMGVPASAIRTEAQSRNTHENATYSYRLLSPLGVRRILLVTSAAHMPRASALFRHAGFDVVPAPCDFRTGWGSERLLFRVLPDPGNLTDSDSAIKEYVGIAVYKARGWI